MPVIGKKIKQKEEIENLNSERLLLMRELNHPVVVSEVRREKRKRFLKIMNRLNELKEK
ncbi:MAG: hypothetical protein ABIA76_00780 [Candidatus Diapherotrites archaeon]